MPRVFTRVGAVVLGGDFQGLGVLRSLGRQGVPTYLLDSGPCIGRFSRYTAGYRRCPNVRQEGRFLSFLMELAREEDLGGWLLFPNDDETVRFLARHKLELERSYRVTTPPWEVVRFAYDKRLTYELAEGCGVAIPRTFYPRDVRDVEGLSMEFPVIIKPAVKEPFYHRTRKKAIPANNKSELIKEFTRVAELAGGCPLMVQELIPGGAKNLFSVGSLYKNGEFLGRVVARRTRQHPMDFGHATTYA